MFLKLRSQTASQPASQPAKLRGRPQNADRLVGSKRQPAPIVYQRDPATKHEFEDNRRTLDTTNNTAALARYTPY